MTTCSFFSQLVLYYSGDMILDDVDKGLLYTLSCFAAGLEVSNLKFAY